MFDHHIALHIENATKSFANSEAGRRFLPFRRPANGHGTDKPKRIVAVDHVSLDVQRGEIFGILGANGSGKSTLIRLISTLLIPDEGTITVFGLDVTRDEMAVKRLINRVSVDAAFFKKLSAMENLMYAARLYGLPTDEALHQATHILTRLGIPKERLSEPLEHMSRGMQQKVAVARGLLSSPIMLLLDEPTTGLDPRSKRDVQVFVEELRDTHDATILLTTHDMDEADRLCDRIAILDGGRIIALDTPAGLKARVPSNNDHETTMEDVFMYYSGKSLAEDFDDE